MITFRKSGLSDLVIPRGRLYPAKTPIEINQDRLLTESNNPIVVNYGDHLELLEISLEGLTRDSYDGTVNGIKSWFKNSAINFAENNFTIEDEHGESFTVRYWAGNFDMQETGENNFSVKLKLLIE